MIYAYWDLGTNNLIVVPQQVFFSKLLTREAEMDQDVLNQCQPERSVDAKQLLLEQLLSAEQEAEDLRILMGMLPSEITNQQNEALARLLSK